MSLKDKIIHNKLPNHVAIIMDGNGRWAKKRGNIRIFGHQNSIKAVRETIETASELDINFLTLFAFSTENWERPKKEIKGLMTLLSKTITHEIKNLLNHNIKLRVIGEVEKLPKSTFEKLKNAVETTKNNTGLNLVLAISYSSQQEILNAAKKIAEKAKKNLLNIENINKEIFEENLATKHIPSPDLLIRTSGEYRISNFMLWQLAYAELYFTNTFWPDFRKEDFYEALINFQNRERRFGLTK